MSAVQCGLVCYAIAVCDKDCGGEPCGAMQSCVVHWAGPRCSLVRSGRKYMLWLLNGEVSRVGELLEPSLRTAVRCGEMLGGAVWCSGIVWWRASTSCWCCNAALLADLAAARPAAVVYRERV